MHYAMRMLYSTIFFFISCIFLFIVLCRCYARRYEKITWAIIVRSWALWGTFIFGILALVFEFI